ncbi:MAG: hypothetical protein K5897_09915 [Eubacterium sp.]|nr:hypothetical protein [Eubacterium sp.]
MARIILEVRLLQKAEHHDVEVSDEITAHELVKALNAAYELGINLTDIGKCFLRAENPIVLLKGNRRLYEFGVHTGTIINVT